MVSFMPCSTTPRNIPVPTLFALFRTRSLSQLQHCLWLAGLLLVLISAAWATGFTIVSAATRLEGNVLRLNARINYDLSETVIDALDNGVPLTIQVQMEVWRKRDWLWDETIASIQQRFRLEYHALARQYLVTNLNNGELRSFPSRPSAIDHLGRLYDFPLLDHGLLDPAARYYGRLRARLDIESLPAPLRPVAYLSADWRLTSDWYAWPL